MKLYLLRHAIAVESADWSSDDESRPLTDVGIIKMRQGAKNIAKLIPALDIIITSPLVRAQQTAALVSASYPPKKLPKLLISNNLAPGSRVFSLQEELGQYPDSSKIMLVGHQPNLGDLLGYFVSGNQRVHIPLKKGGLAYIEAPQAEALGQLEWLLTAKQLRSLATIT